MSRPILEYTSTLRKIHEIYTSHLPIIESDLLNIIEHYESKKNVEKQDLIAAEERTKKEWNDILVLLCESLIHKCSSTRKRRKIFGKELKKLEKLKTRVQENHLELEEYDNIYDKQLKELRADIISENTKQKISFRRYWSSLLLGFIFGIIAGIIGTIIVQGI